MIFALAPGPAGSVSWAMLSRRAAASVTAVLAVLALVTVAALGDRPLGHRRSAPAGARPRRAAVAIRDHVVPFQKWGTKLFTVPALDDAYDHVEYLTESYSGDGRDDLIAALDRALDDADVVDLFLLAHSNRMIDDVVSLDRARLAKLRLVYNTGCGNADQGERWLDLGADVYVGHAARRSASPAFYFYFLRRWVHGYTVAEAVSEANAKAVSRMHMVGVGGDADPRAIAVGSGGVWLGAR